MRHPQDIYCIGAAHWDIIGHSAALMGLGQDVPGTIRHVPGGVALNVAVSLAARGFAPSLISVLGQDRAGDDLAAMLQASGVGSAHLVRSPTRSTDCYVAIEGGAGLIGAIATAEALESLTLDAFAAVSVSPHPLVLLDSGLSSELLAALSATDWATRADLRLVGAAPAKAVRLAPFLGHPQGTFYLNLSEASALCGTEFADSTSAATALVALGAARVLITDGARAATDASTRGAISACPPKVQAQRVTGAGDIFTAAHIAACVEGLSPGAALDAALAAAALHVASEHHERTVNAPSDLRP